MFKGKLVDNFLSESECAFVIDTVNTKEVWERNGNEHWDNRAVHIQSIYTNFGNDLGDLLKNKTLLIKKYIEDEYQLTQEVYPDIVSVCRWFPGNSQAPHADDMKPANIAGFEHRVFGSIIYLNTEFSGGVTYYPDYGIEVTPEVGKLAIHPGDSEHMHGVTEVQGGIRYTIASFWTYERSRALGWSVS